MPRGRPPLLMELDKKLLRFLNAMRARGGVINSHVVRATADALIRSNHSPGLQHLRNFSMPRYGFNQSTSEWATTEEWEQQLDLLFQRDHMMSAEFLTFVIWRP